MLCSKLHRQEVFNLILFIYKIILVIATPKPQTAAQERSAAPRGGPSALPAPPAPPLPPATHPLPHSGSRTSHCAGPCSATVGRYLHGASRVGLYNGNFDHGSAYTCTASTSNSRPRHRDGVPRPAEVPAHSQHHPHLLYHHGAP